MKYAIFAIVALAVGVFAMANSGGVTNVLAQSPPGSIAAVNGPNPGEAIISWAAVDGAAYYRIGWIAYEDYDAIIATGRPWIEGFAFVDVQNLGQTSRTVTRLTPGILYAFIVGSNDTQYGAPQWSAWAQLMLTADESSCPTDTTGTTQPPTTVVAGDYDADNDGLIEIRTLAQLDAIRYDLDGDNRISSDDDEDAYYSAFPDAITGMGCPSDGCIGFELAANLDFDTNGNGHADAGDAYWNDAAGWLPIGSSDKFTATFDGGGHTIANLYIDSDGYVGLFAYTGAGSDIRGVGLVSASVTGGGSVGGLVAQNTLGHISDSYVTGSVSGEGRTGGLVGDNTGPITDSYFNGNVSAPRYAHVGGLVGLNNSPGRITGGYATGRVSGNSYVGGLVGNNDGGAITGSYATSRVSGDKSVGGLVGFNDNDSTTTGSYATGSVTGSTNVGGLVGNSNPDNTFTSSYATGSVTGSSRVGGLVGQVHSRSTITGSYAIGSVTASSNVGGLVGNIYASGVVISASYWDTQTTGQTSSGGSEDSAGKTTAELQTPTSASGIYATWDPDVWDFGTSSQYPVLKVEGLSVADQR